MTTMLLERPKVRITLADRCCATANGAEAAEVAITLHEGNEPLLLCKHHWNENAARIFALNPYDIFEKE
jgi:hypothetical protein